VTFSLLPTASLLCALEKDGYGRLVLLPFGEMEDTRRSNSGIGSEDLRLVGGGLWLELRSGVVEVLGWSFDEDFRDDREDRCRGLSLDFGVSTSLSFSRTSRTFEGILKALRWRTGEWGGEIRWGSLELFTCRCLIVTG